MDDASLQGYLASLPAQEAVQIRKRLDALRTDCGCAAGAIVMLGATTSWIVHAQMAPVPGRSWQGTVAAGFAVLIVSTLVGKLIGLGLARVRLRLALRGLRRRAIAPR